MASASASVMLWKSQYGMTFQAYRRGLRLGRALGRLKGGASVTSAAFDSGYDSLSGFSEALQQLAGRSPAASRDATPVIVTRLLTPLGPMIAGATDEGVCLLEFSDRRMLETQLRRLGKLMPGPLTPGRNPMLDRIAVELERYFAGELREFSVPLVVPGSDFQKRVWDGLRRIPYGETRSYGQIAKNIRNPYKIS